MKKNVLKCVCPGGLVSGPKLLLCMKLTVFLLVISFMQVSATVYSQEKFTLDYKHISAEKAFSRIQKESDYRFFYTHDDIKKLGKVDIRVKAATLPDILNQLLSNGLTYKI